MARIVWFLRLAAAFVTLDRASATAQRTSSLSWVRLEGAEHCISTQALAQRVEARIGRSVFVSASQADLSLEGHVQREGDTFVVRLVVSDPDGTVLGRRVLRVPGTDCRALESSLVLVIAIGIDPDATLSPEARGPAGLSEEAKTMLAQLELPKLTDRAVMELAVPDPRAISPAALSGKRERPAPRAAGRPTRDEQAGVQIGIHAGLGLELGILPGPGLGFGVRLSVRVPPVWPFELSIAGLVPQSEQLGQADSTGEFQFWAVGLATCPLQLGTGQLAFEACAGVRVGVLHSRGLGFRQPLSAASSWGDVSLQAGPTLGLGSVQLALRGRVAAPIARDTFAYEDRRGRRQEAHRAGVVGGGVELAAGFFF